MKEQLRKSAKEKRKQICSLDLSEKIRKNLISSEFYKKAKNIMCYSSIGSEVSTANYFNDGSKNWFLPRVEGQDMLVCPYFETQMCEGKFNILEPQSQSVDFSEIDLIIIPALCVDKKGYRIGYGKGYYDRFLKNNPNKAVRVVLAYSDLFIDDVFHDEFDEKCDYVVTEKGMYKC